LFFFCSESTLPLTAGARNDLTAVTDLIRAGGGLKRVAEAAPEAIIKFGRGLAHLHGLLHPPVHRIGVKVFLLWGPSGTGKTRSAFLFDPALYTVFDQKAPWFDGYQEEKTILLDEMGPGQLCINFLKRFLDVYPVNLPVKGASIPMRATTVIITSNYPMREWYPAASLTDMNALERRITKAWNMSDPLDMHGIVDEMHGIIGAADHPPPAPTAPAFGGSVPQDLPRPLSPHARPDLPWDVLSSDDDCCVARFLR